MKPVSLFLSVLIVFLTANVFAAGGGKDAGGGTVLPDVVPSLELSPNSALYFLPETSFQIEYSLRETFKLNSNKVAVPVITVTGYKITPQSSVDESEAYSVSLDKVTGLTLSSDGFIGTVDTSDTGGGYQFVTGLTSVVKLAASVFPFTGLIKSVNGGEDAADPMGVASDVFKEQTKILKEIEQKEKEYLTFLWKPTDSDFEEVSNLKEKALTTLKTKLVRTGKLVFKVTPKADGTVKELAVLESPNWTIKGEGGEVSWEFSASVEFKPELTTVFSLLSDSSGLPDSVEGIGTKLKEQAKELNQLKAKAEGNGSSKEKSKAKSDWNGAKKVYDKFRETALDAEDDKVVYRVPSAGMLVGKLAIALQGLANLTQEADDIDGIDLKTVFENQRYPVAQFGRKSYVDYGAKAFEKLDVKLGFDSVTGALVSFTKEKKGASEALGGLSDAIGGLATAKAAYDAAQPTELSEATAEADLLEAQLRKAVADHKLELARQGIFDTEGDE